MSELFTQTNKQKELFRTEEDIVANIQTQFGMPHTGKDLLLDAKMGPNKDQSSRLDSEPDALSDTGMSDDVGAGDTSGILHDSAGGNKNTITGTNTPRSSRTSAYYDLLRSQHKNGHYKAPAYRVVDKIESPLQAGASALNYHDDFDTDAVQNAGLHMAVEQTVVEGNIMAAAADSAFVIGKQAGNILKDLKDETINAKEALKAGGQVLRLQGGKSVVKIGGATLRSTEQYLSSFQVSTDDFTSSVPGKVKEAATNTGNVLKKITKVVLHPLRNLIAMGKVILISAVILLFLIIVSLLGQMSGTTSTSVFGANRIEDVQTLVQKINDYRNAAVTEGVYQAFQNDVDPNGNPYGYDSLTGQRSNNLQHGVTWNYANGIYNDTAEIISLAAVYYQQNWPRSELLSAFSDNVPFTKFCRALAANVVEDGVPINYITYIKDNPNQDFVTIEFSENYYYIYKRKATDHSKELWLSGRMNNTRKLRMTITNITARDNTVDVAVQIENAPDGVKSVQARIDNYGPYTQLIKNEGGIWSGSIDTGLYTPELVAGTHFVGVEAFDNENKKWTEYKDYSTPSDNPTIKWVFETGDSIQSSATINEANVYVGSNDGNLYCIDRDTGSQKWCIQTGDFVISKPAITSEGKIVFGSGDEFVYCASADDGNIIWNTKLGGSVLSDPLTSEGRVFIGCGDGKIYCLNSASGEIVWEYQTDGLMRQRPILENGILYAFVRDTYIWYAIDASTGQLIWRGNANTDESLFVCGDVRPVIANGKLWCIDAQNTRPAYLSLDTGELAWTSTLEKVSSRGMTTNGSTVFYSSNSGRQITAFDAETNQVVWQKDLRYDNKDRDLQEMQIDSALVYNGTSLIHVAERGRITALNPDNGEILWCIDAAGYPERVFWSTPEATDGLVIATGIDGKVYAVEYTH